MDIHEDYSATEREERLVAAKSIVDLNLTELALENIISSYSGVLEQSYIEKAKALLSELRGEVVGEEPEIDNSESEEYATTISAPEYEDNWDD